MMINYYSILAVCPDAKTEDIHDAYLKLAREHAPRMPGDPEDRFKVIALAWGVLKSRMARKAYDAELKARGLNCDACGGKGELFVSIGFTRQKAQLCNKCSGTGRSDYDAK
jgi:DnaJ-class molecular chaperone